MDGRIGHQRQRGVDQREDQRVIARVQADDPLVGLALQQRGSRLDTPAEP